MTSPVTPLQRRQAVPTIAAVPSPDDLSAPAHPALPTTEQALLSALLFADLHTTRTVLELLADGDVAEFRHRVIVGALRAVADAGLSGPHAVFDHLQRTGVLAGDAGRQIVGALNDLVTARGEPLALPGLLATVLAATFRREIESYGTALAAAAQGAAEADLWPQALAGATKLRGIHDRLERARGGVA